MIVLKNLLGISLILVLVFSATEVSCEEVTNLPWLNRNLPEYKRDLERRIKRNWFPPRDGSNVELTARIESDGSITNVAASRFGSKLCADAAIKAVNSTTPVTSPPGGKPFTVSINFGWNKNGFDPRLQLNEEQAIALQKSFDDAFIRKDYENAVAYADTFNALKNEDQLLLNDVMAHDLLAAKLMDTNPKEAREQLYKALSIDSKYEPSKKRLAEWIEKAGGDPTSSDYMLEQARTSRRQRDVPNATRWYREALKLSNDSDVFAELQEMFVNVEIDDWNYFIAKYPNTVEGRLGRGQMFLRTNRKSDAKKDFEKALELDPSSQSATKLLMNIDATEPDANALLHRGAH